LAIRHGGSKVPLIPYSEIPSEVGWGAHEDPMIRPERLTIKGQEALRDAGELARSRGNPVVNDAHLFAALLAQDEGVVQPLLQKAGLNVTALAQDTEREIARFPTQAGGAAEPTFSREVQEVFDRAEAEAGKLGDQDVSP